MFLTMLRLLLLSAKLAQNFSKLFHLKAQSCKIILNQSLVASKALTFIRQKIDEVYNLD